MRRHLLASGAALLVLAVAVFTLWLQRPNLTTPAPLLSGAAKTFGEKNVSHQDSPDAREALLRDFLANCKHSAFDTHAFCQRINASNLADFLTLLDSINDESYIAERYRLEMEIYRRWAQFARGDALGAAMKLRPKTRAAALSLIARDWLAQDRDAAWRFTTGLADLESHDPELHVIADFLGTAAFKDPSWTVDQLRTLKDSNTAGEATEQVFASLASIDERKAAQLINSLPNDLRDHASFSLAMRYGEANPQQAIETLAQLDLPAETISPATEKLARTWIGTSPSAVAAWLEQSPDNPLFSTVSRTLADVWTWDDALAAGAWLDAHASNPAFIPAMKSHLDALASQDLHAAQQWVQTLSDSSVRSQLTAELVRLGYR